MRPFGRGPLGSARGQESAGGHSESRSGGPEREWAAQAQSRAWAGTRCQTTGKGLGRGQLGRAGARVRWSLCQDESQLEGSKSRSGGPERESVGTAAARASAGRHSLEQGQSRPQLEVTWRSPNTQENRGRIVNPKLESWVRRMIRDES